FQSAVVGDATAAPPRRTAKNGKGNAQSLVVRRGMSCPVCARALSVAEAGLFSYDSAVGACRPCRGFGRTIGVDLRKVIPDPDLPLGKAAVRPWYAKRRQW